MPNTTPEDKKLAEEQQKREQDAVKQADKENTQLELDAGNAELTSSGQKREEVVLSTAPVPETVSNILEEGKGYYVYGKLVNPNGEPVK